MDFYGLANGSVATTDNVSGVETGQPGRRGDLFSDVRPGFLLTYYAPRMIHELSSEVDFLYHVFTGKPTVTFRAGWKAFLIPTPRSEMSLNADAAMGQINALSVSQSPLAEDATQVLPPGRVDTRNVTGAENYSWAASELSRVWQRAFGRYSTTDDSVANMADVKTFSGEVGGALGIDRTFKHNNVLLELGGSYVHMLKLDPDNRQPGGSRLDRQWNPRAMLVWNHDINKEWSTSLDVGGVYVMPTGQDPYHLDESRKNAPFPVFGLTAAYTDVWGRAQASARREVTPNLFLAQNTLADSVTVTAAMPLKLFDPNSQQREPRVVGIGSAGFERTQLIDPQTGNLKGQFEVARIDLGVGWSPHNGQTYGLRYEATYQTGDSYAGMIVPTFLRNTFYFTFSLRYPEDILVRVPRRGQSVRADKKDLAPIGAEPVIVDPQEFLEGGDGGGR